MTVPRGGYGRFGFCPEDCGYIDTIQSAPQSNRRERHFSASSLTLWTGSTLNNCGQHVEPALGCDLSCYYYNPATSELEQWRRNAITGADMVLNWSASLGLLPSGLDPLAGFLSIWTSPAFENGGVRRFHVAHRTATASITQIRDFDDGTILAEDDAFAALDETTGEVCFGDASFLFWARNAFAAWVTGDVADFTADLPDLSDCVNKIPGELVDWKPNHVAALGQLWTARNGQLYSKTLQGFATPYRCSWTLRNGGTEDPAFAGHASAHCGRIYGYDPTHDLCYRFDEAKDEIKSFPAKSTNPWHSTSVSDRFYVVADTQLGGDQDVCPADQLCGETGGATPPACCSQLQPAAVLFSSAFIQDCNFDAGCAQFTSCTGVFITSNYFNPPCQGDCIESVSWQLTDGSPGPPIGKTVCFVNVREHSCNVYEEFFVIGNHDLTGCLFLIVTMRTTQGCVYVRIFDLGDQPTCIS